MQNTNAVTAKVLALGNRLLSTKRDDAHFQAVQAQCTCAVEVYSGVLHLVAIRNGIAAQSLVRTLFETIVGAIILAKHPEKLDDFRNHGKLTWLRMARSTPPDSPFAKKLATLRAATRAECDALHAQFKGGNWHLLKTSDSFAEAELRDNFHGRYYVRASAIAHGQPFVVVQPVDMEGKNWKIQAPSKLWKQWPLQACVPSMLLMLHMVECLSRVFALGIETELAPVKQEVTVLANKKMKSALH